MAITVDLADKSAIVTGSGRGIGRATAMLLARAGACLTIADLDEATAASTAEEIRSQGASATHVRTDITQPDDSRKMVEAALAAYGRVDILVNNAARWTTKLFKDMTPQDYDNDIKVTLYGTIYATRAALDPMMEQKYGHIVNLISDAGRIGEAYLSI